MISVKSSPKDGLSSFLQSTVALHLERSSLLISSKPPFSVDSACSLEVQLAFPPKKPNPCDKSMLHVSLYCEQGQLHRYMNEQEENGMTDSVQCDESGSASGNQKYNTSTKKPTTTNDVFPFRLNIYMVSEEAQVDPGRWFLSHHNVNKKTCACHKGHVKLRPHELHNYLANMSEEDKELAKQCVEHRSPPWFHKYNSFYLPSRPDILLVPAS
ncbi:hypothetical protein IV203_000422 [Nitzschia inconspicua]|uniref:Uncharacterized protein n=1 Tax=Nitzschia inconspicua TaxID=303405 RepID=A0A9K3PQN5_9STRA|nr:hypothetical protein IV203_000422 [Nitzschia inconspicua]